MADYAVTVIGRDRPGVLARVTAVFTDNDCHIVGASGMVPRNLFGLVFFLETTMTEAALKAALTAELGPADLDALHICPVTPEPLPERREFRTRRIQGFGPDRPDAIAEVAELLRRMDLTVRSMLIRSLPLAAGDRCLMWLVVEVPHERDQELEGGLQTVKERLGFEQLAPISELPEWLQKR